MARLRGLLDNGDFEVPAGRGMLTFAHNQLPKLTLGEEMLKQLMERRFEGLFHSVSLSSNLTVTFSEAVIVSGNWFQIVCSVSGTRTVAEVGERIEEHGQMLHAKPGCVSEQARRRQREERGTLGCGNH